MALAKRGCTRSLRLSGCECSLRLSGCECSLGLLGDRVERSRLVDREIRQNLAAHGYAGVGETVDKHAVGHAERTDGSVEALDPERAERPLLALAIAERILAGLVDGGLGGANGILAATTKTLGGLGDFFGLAMSPPAAFAASHD